MAKLTEQKNVIDNILNKKALADITENKVNDLVDLLVKHPWELVAWRKNNTISVDIRRAIALQYPLITIRDMKSYIIEKAYIQISGPVKVTTRANTESYVVYLNQQNKLSEDDVKVYNAVQKGDCPLKKEYGKDIICENESQEFCPLCDTIYKYTINELREKNR